jgi:23S rRNA pseudouridine2605 synthase
MKPQSVRVVKQLPTKTWIEFRLNEGKNREIRRLCEYVGLTVDKLKRLAIGGLTIDGVAPGKHRILSREELLLAVGINENGEERKTKKSEFVSRKRSIDLVKKRAQPGTVADDEAFHKFRRETYFDSLKQIQDSKAEVSDKIAKLETQVFVEQKKEYYERKSKHFEKKKSFR